MLLHDGRDQATLVEAEVGVVRPVHAIDLRGTRRAGPGHSDRRGRVAPGPSLPAGTDERTAVAASLTASAGPDAIEPEGHVPDGPSSFPPGWYPDPLGRHEQRWYDGMRWTDHVGDAGRPGLDPLAATSGIAPTAGDASNLSRAALVAALAAVVLSVVPYVGVLAAVLALTLTLVARARGRAAGPLRDGRRTAAGALGAAALVVATAITWVAWTLASDRGPIGDALRDYVACLEERDPTACESAFRERLLDELGPVPRTGG